MKQQFCLKCRELLDPDSPCYGCKKREVEQEQAEKLERIRWQAYGTPLTTGKEETEALSY